MCRAEYLNYLRVREWQDLHGQLQTLAGDLGVAVRINAGRTDRRCTPALLAGLLSHIGLQEPSRLQPAASAPKGRAGRAAEYLGARGARFAIFPGSALARKPPDWIMAAELVETSRLWARTVAPDRAGVGRAARPGTWSSAATASRTGRRSAAAVIASEKVTLYGVPLVADRTVRYAAHRPGGCARELFIRHALVEGDWQTQPPVLRREPAAAGRGRGAGAPGPAPRTWSTSEDAVRLLRRADPGGRGVRPALRHLVEARPAGADPDLLTFTRERLLNDDAAGVSADDYPDVWTSESAGVPAAPLTYALRAGQRAPTA